VGSRALIRGFKKNLPYIAEKMPAVPELIFDALKKVAEGENEKLQAQQMEALQQRIKLNQQRLSYILIGVAGVVCAAIMLGQPMGHHTLILDVPILSWIGVITGAVFVWLGLKK
jgi:ubiquinone biosynthesis protein